MEEILDDLTEPTLPPSRKGVDKAIWIYAGITTFLYLFYELILRDLLPTNLSDDPLINTNGLFKILVLILICNLFVRKTNQLAPAFDEKIFVIWGASTIFYGEVFFRIIMEYFRFESISPSTIWFILKISMAMSIIAGTCLLYTSDAADE